MIIFDDYTELGYNLIPETEFQHYITRAVLSAQRFTFGRFQVTDDITENNLRGLFEIADLIYSNDMQINVPVQSFQNANYSETYAISLLQVQQTLDSKIYDIMLIYFTREQLYRGVSV